MAAAKQPARLCRTPSLPWGARILYRSIAIFLEHSGSAAHTPGGSTLQRSPVLWGQKGNDLIFHFQVYERIFQTDKVIWVLCFFFFFFKRKKSLLMISGLDSNCFETGEYFSLFFFFCISVPYPQRGEP